MFRHSTNTASFFSVLMAALIFSLSLPGVAAARSCPWLWWKIGKAYSLGIPKTNWLME